MTERSKGHAPGVLVGGVENRLPHGTRDLLPAACRRRGMLTRSLLDTFDSWGFQQVATPSLEYDEVLGRGLSRSERARCVRFIEPSTGELVSLRADVTPQIARLVAQRVGGAVGHDEVLRLSYAAEVIVLPGASARGGHERAQQHQVGVEHVGAAGEGADAELIALCHSALRAVGLRDHAFDLSHIGVAQKAMAVAGLADGAAAEVRGRLARKDPRGLRRLLDSVEVTVDVADALVSLCELHGAPAILDRARECLAPLGVSNELDRLARVVDLVATIEPGLEEHLTIDLGEVRGFDYYSGLRLRVWAPGVSRPVIRGGRYDHLLGRYGAELPATGFAVDLDALERALDHSGTEARDTAPNAAHLVALDAGTRVLWRRAADLAKRARASGERAWVGDGLSLEDARTRAQSCAASRLTYLEGNETTVVERCFDWVGDNWVAAVVGDGDAKTSDEAAGTGPAARAGHSEQTGRRS